MGRPKIYENSRDEILERIAADMELPLEEVEKVVSWSYMKANKAMKENRQIEISGLGKFMISKAKAKRRLKNLEENVLNPGLSEQKKLEIESEIGFIKDKIGDGQIERISEAPSEGPEKPGESA